MNLNLLHRTCCPASLSPYQLAGDAGPGVAWANQFLDAQRLRGLSLCTLRAYAYDLLHFARWFSRTPRPLSELTESALREYVGYQLDAHPKPEPQTINHRLQVVHCLYRFHYACEIPAPSSTPQPARRASPPFGFGRTRRSVARLRVKQPHRLVVPLSAQEVSRFWNSFRTFRDLSIIALMLFDGLRSREVLHIQFEDLHLSETELRVHGKGNRQRLLPLPQETVQALQNYVLLERPPTCSPYVFVSLKGKQRGQPMTPAGLRSLFRHHRIRTQVGHANPHRFRHTFGADMVRAGISLPALMRLMGHTQIRTTMLYVQLSPQDVWREFYRAIENRLRLAPPEKT